MASRYHWIGSGPFHNWTNGVASTQVNLAIPAGAVLKKFTLTNGHVASFKTQIGVSNLPQLVFDSQVEIIGGGYTQHSIFDRNIAVPKSVVALYDVLTAERVYSCWYQCGDELMSFNQQTSYGGTGHSAMTCRLTYRLGTPTGAAFVGTGTLEFAFKALYYQ